jgi:5-methylthioadenosine/S-adenosylhomocysteine deaminase
MTSFDVLIEGGTVVTFDKKERVLEGDVLLRDGKVHQVAAHGRTSPRPGARTVDARGCIVMPGFVQPHVHLCQALFRGVAEDVPLLTWLKKYIWPLEGAHNPETLYASARLGIAELLLGGTTTVLDMGTVQHTDVLFEVAAESGMRYLGGKAMMDKGAGRPEGLKENTGQSLSRSRRLAEQWHGKEEGRIGYAFAPRFILSCTDQLMKDTVRAAREIGCLLHTHASENPGEIAAVKKATGKDNVAALHALGFTGDDVVLAHCVHVTKREMKILADTGTRVAHCPSTNLKLASGTAPIPELLERGISVGIAADGAPCNNRLSGFSEARLASLLQKPAHGADAMSAKDTLRMATRGGAEVLGLGDVTGALEKGKRGDVVVVDASRPHMRPRTDPYTQLVYQAEAADVRHVFVDGNWLVRDRHLVRWNESEIGAEANLALRGAMRRAGMKAPKKGPR